MNWQAQALRLLAGGMDVAEVAKIMSRTTAEIEELNRATK